MSIWSKIRRSPATLAVLGGAGQFAGAMVEDRKVRDAETRATRSRLGETSLRSILDRQAQEATERRQQGSPLYQAQVGAAQATQATQEEQLLGAQSKNAMSQAEMDWLQTQPPDVQALYFQRIRQTPGQAAALEGATGALEAQRNAAANKPASVRSQEEQVRELEDEWLVAKKPMEAEGKVQEAFTLGLEMGLSTKTAPRFATWVTQEYARWKTAQLRPQNAGVGVLALPEPGALGAVVPQAAMPAAPAAPAAPVGVGGLAPAQPPFGTPVDTPAPFSVPQSVVPQAAMPVAENTAGLTPDEVAYVRSEAARAGITFNDARARLEAQVR